MRAAQLADARAQEGPVAPALRLQGGRAARADAACRVGRGEAGEAADARREAARTASVRALLLGAASTAAFTLPPARRAAPWTRIRATNEDWRQACDSDGVVSYYDYGVRLGGADSDAAVAASLEAKLKSFEATPEEERAATLGGMIPGSSGTDAFDISLYLAAIPLFGSLALFLFFPPGTAVVTALSIFAIEVMTVPFVVLGGILMATGNKLKPRLFVCGHFHGNVRFTGEAYGAPCPR